MTCWKFTELEIFFLGIYSKVLWPPKYRVSLGSTPSSSLSKTRSPALILSIVYIWPSTSAPNQGHPPLFLSTIILCFYLPWLKALALNGLFQCPSLVPSFSNLTMPGTSQEFWRFLFSKCYDCHTIWFVLNVYKNERRSLPFNLWCTRVGVPRVTCHTTL